MQIKAKYNNILKWKRKSETQTNEIVHCVMPVVRKFCLLSSTVSHLDKATNQLTYSEHTMLS